MLDRVSRWGSVRFFAESGQQLAQSSINGSIKLNEEESSRDGLCDRQCDRQGECTS